MQNIFKNQKKTSDYTVLVIDDDEAIREAIIDNMKEVGYTTISAVNGEEALKLLDTMELPSAVIIDLMMPQMGGEEFLSRARVRYGRHGFPPVIVLTAALHGETIARLIEAEDYLPKPFNTSELLRHVCNLIDRHTAFARS